MNILQKLKRMKRNFIWNRRKFNPDRHDNQLFDNDEDLTDYLKKNKNKKGFQYKSEHAYPVAEYMHEDKICLKTMKHVFKDTINLKLSHWDKDDFQNICQMIKLTKNLVGDYVEIGVYTGSSGNLAMCYMDNANIKRNCFFIDTFEGFNYNTAFTSFDSGFKGTHLIDDRDIIPFLHKMLSRYKNKYKIIQSNICINELPSEIKKIAVCNIDVDMYEPTRDALNKIKNKIVKNGVIIVEDFGHTPALAGSNLAVREFLGVNKNFLPIYFSSGQMVLFKK